MEEPAGGRSGSMAINLPLRSHLGPINCCPCHLLGTPVLSIPWPHHSQVSPAWDVSARQEDWHSKTKNVLIENNWLFVLVWVCVLCTQVYVTWQSAVTASFLHLLISEYREVHLCSNETAASLVHIMQFKTFYCSAKPLQGGMVFFTTDCMAVKSGEMQWDPLSSEMPQIQSPLEPSSFLIWTYRDVAAEHHKGAAYQHRCYLVCLFHRGVRTPPYTHQHHWIRIKDISSGETQHENIIPMKHFLSAEYIYIYIYED